MLNLVVLGGLFLVYNSSCRTKKPIIKEIILGKNIRGKEGVAQWVILVKILGLGLYEAVIAIPWIMWNGFDNCVLSLLVIC